MRILIIGRSGQLARCLADEKPSGVECALWGRDRFDLAAIGGTGAREAARALTGHRPDAIVNAAAYTAVDKAETERETAFAVNRDGPAVLAGFCAREGVPFVHVSTDYVFSGAKTGPYVEDDATGPVNVYGASKLAGEEAVRKAGGRFAVVRTSWVYSAYGQNFVATMLRAGTGRDRVRVVDDQRGCPTSAHELAKALWTVALRLASPEGGLSGVYHYAGAGAATWADFAEAIFDEAKPWLGRRPVVERIGTADYPTQAARPANSVLDCSKVRAVFGLAAVPWRESLAKVIARRFDTAGRGEE